MYELFRELISKAQPTGSILQVETDAFSSCVIFAISDYWTNEVYTKIVNVTEDQLQICRDHIWDFYNYAHEWF